MNGRRLPFDKLLKGDARGSREQVCPAVGITCAALSAEHQLHSNGFEERCHASLTRRDPTEAACLDLQAMRL